MSSWYPPSQSGGMEAMRTYVQHLADLQNPALQPFWQQVWAQQLMCLRQPPGGGMGMYGPAPSPGMGMRRPRREDISGEIGRRMMDPMGGAEEMPADDAPDPDAPAEGDPPPTFRQGEGVVPTEAHAPEHRGRVGQIVQVVTDQPFYSVDFGTGHPHKWYAQSELRAAPPEAQAGEVIGE